MQVVRPTGADAVLAAGVVAPPIGEQLMTMFSDFRNTQL